MTQQEEMEQLNRKMEELKEKQRALQNRQKARRARKLPPIQRDFTNAIFRVWQADPADWSKSDREIYAKRLEQFLQNNRSGFLRAMSGRDEVRPEASAEDRTDQLRMNTGYSNYTGYNDDDE